MLTSPASRRVATLPSSSPTVGCPAPLQCCLRHSPSRMVLMNSTMKIVRGKIEKAYADRIESLYTPEGKSFLNAKNLESLA